MADTSEVAHISWLPNELLAYILEHLPADEAVRFRLVCRWAADLVPLALSPRCLYTPVHTHNKHGLYPKPCAVSPHRILNIGFVEKTAIMIDKWASVGAIECKMDLAAFSEVSISTVLDFCSHFCPIFADGREFVSLCLALCKHRPHLVSLSFLLNSDRGIQIGDKLVPDLADMLAQNKSLVELNVDRQNLRQSVTCIASALLHHETIRRVSLRGNKIDINGVKAIAKVLASNTPITHLDLSSNKMSGGAAHIFDALKTNTHLRYLSLFTTGIDRHNLADVVKFNKTLFSLNLSLNQLNNEDTVKFFEALNGSSSLRILILGSCDISNSGLEAIGNLFKRGSPLHTLDLGGNDIVCVGAKCLVDGLVHDSSLKILRLTNNYIRLTGAGAIGKMLAVNTCLEHLALGSNFLGFWGCSFIGEGLKSNTSLATLDLSDNAIEGGLQDISEALLENRSLQRLSLYSNRLSQDSVIKLAQCLKTNSGLTYLDLNHCDIKPGGAETIGNALEENTALKHLDLNHNELGLFGASAIGRALEKNTTLETLILNFTWIKCRGAVCIAMGLAKNKALRKLDLSQNIIGGLGGLELANALKENTTLIDLNLHDNNLRSSGVSDIADAVENHNTSLQTLDISKNSVDISVWDELSHLSVRLFNRLKRYKCFKTK